ncbi:MAG: hypothetical protein AAF938_04830 [Myxococcota bacterium]
MSSPLEATWNVEVKKAQRRVEVRMAGLFREADIRAFDAAYREATDRFAGTAHVVLADMRGLRTLAANVGAIFGESIAYARTRGVALCAHLSDETVLRLQTARIARSSSVEDDVTVDVASLEEAQLLCEEARQRLEDGSKLADLRASLTS